MPEGAASYAPTASSGPGCLVLVVGPSGAGKDTLIAFARQRLQGSAAIAFPRRIITRAADPSLEDHASVTPGEFQAMLAGGEFALQWDAHGLSYGIGRCIDLHLAHGDVVVVNVSRQVVPAACQRYPNVLTIEVTAPPAVLAERIGRRGREGLDDIRTRLARTGLDGRYGDCVQIVNDGPVERAGAVFVDILTQRVARPAALTLGESGL